MVIDDLYYKDDLSDLEINEDELICTRCKKSFDKKDILDHVCEKPE